MQWLTGPRYNNISRKKDLLNKPSEISLYTFIKYLQSLETTPTLRATHPMEGNWDHQFFKELFKVTALIADILN